MSDPNATNYHPNYPNNVPSVHSVHSDRVRGFTLIELLISISILGAMLALGVPAFRTYNKQVVFDSLAESIAIQLADARTLALAPESSKTASVVAYGVSFDQATNSISLNRYSKLSPPEVASKIREMTLPAPVILDAVPAQPVLYPINLAGEPSLLPGVGAAIILRNPSLSLRSTRTLTVNATTGQVSVQ